MQQRKPAYSVDQQAQDFFINGYLIHNFTPGPSLDKFIATLKELNTQPQKPNFKWEEKYQHSEDLKPNLYDYDDIFVNFLFDQGVPQLLRQVTGFDLILGDAALRRAHSNIRYMGWHRDTHFYRGKPSAGRMPPLIKMIVYPALGESPTPQLRALPGSHRRVFRSRLLDQAQMFTTKWDTVVSSDTSCFIFNSMLLHSVASQFKSQQPSLRLFYNFCLESQLNQFPGHESLHQHYLKKLASIEQTAVATPQAQEAAQVH